MNIKNHQKFLKLFYNLGFENPNFLIRYFNYSLLSSSPLENALPWWSWKAIDEISKSHFNDTFEYGSGGSTLFIGNISNNHLSVEDDPKWFNLVKNKLENLSLESIELIYESPDFIDLNSFTNSLYLTSLSSPKDLIIIDGQDHWSPSSSKTARHICFYYAEKFIKPGGIIILDDSWRYKDIRVKNHAKFYKCFESIGPCRIGVTSTDFYYY